MSDGLMLTIGEDGVAREYKDDYDVVIHCETQEDQDEVLARLNRPTGEWIVETIRSNVDEWDNCTCTTCGTVFKRFSPKRKYCPECGSYNGGKRDGKKR